MPPHVGGGGTSQSVVTDTIEHWDFESDRRTVCKAGDFGNFIRRVMEMTEYGKPKAGFHSSHTLWKSLQDSPHYHGLDGGLGV
jgi:hypothetical protein